MDSNSDTVKASEIDFDAYQEQEVKVLFTEGCVHERVYPPFYDHQGTSGDGELRTMNQTAAKDYPFTLDPFQERAIKCLEANESVLVSAHTSAGKTVVAEYAIAMAFRDKQRVVYCSPIKALSNQKFRDLQEEFDDVGLMTGDITVNPSATCLVMTTEILRNCLYKGSEMVRELAWVIYDEIHYMRDKERGVVWEESMILLRDKVRFVFLSATIPNARQFAGWMAKLNNLPCNVLYTDYRPTPLQHYVFPAGGQGLYLVVDDKNVFRDENFDKAMAGLSADVVAEHEKNVGMRKAKRQKMQQLNSDIFKITKLILQRQYDPVVIFSFSKRECEANALQMTKLDFCSEQEKTMIAQVFHNAIDSLSEADRKLPQVESILPLLKRGIGIHHGGLLPLLKETIEILFQESLIKVLCATETFSMGLNMPCKTVVFTNAVKFDGRDFRNLSSGEYIQMSGRAGRRGLDDRGIVILMIDEKVEPAATRQMLRGAADPLNSAFHLGYNMLLNLMRVEEADPDYVISRSFHQYQSTATAPKLLADIEALKQQREEIKLSDKDESEIVEYAALKAQIDALALQMRAIRNQPLNLLPFLNPGRLVYVVDGESKWGWGVVISYQKNQLVRGSKTPEGYVADVLLSCNPGGTRRPVPCMYVFALSNRYHINIDSGYSCNSNDSDRTANPLVIPVQLSSIESLSTVRLYVPKSIKSHEDRVGVIRSLVTVIERFSATETGLPHLDPIQDMKIQDDAFKQVVRRIETLEDRLVSLPINEDAARLEALYSRHVQHQNFTKQINDIDAQIKNLNTTIAFRRQLKAMRRVLRRTGCTTQDNVVDLKGRVACEITTSDELLVTELLFSGVFNDLSVDQTIALCSALIFDEKNDEASEAALNETLRAPFLQLKEHAKRLAEMSNECRVTIDVKEYVGRWNPAMMPLVYAWARGSSFADICAMAKSIFEGSIIRCLRRLVELLKELSSAAKLMGNQALQTKFDSGTVSITRDIVFAASLYL